MNDPDRTVDAAVALFGIDLRPEWRDAAVAHFVALQAAAAPVTEFPFGDEAEYAPVFAP